MGRHSNRFSMDEIYFGWIILYWVWCWEDDSAFKESNCGCGFFLPREVIIPDKRGRWLAWIMETYWPSRIFTYNLFDNKTPVWYEQPWHTLEVLIRVFKNLFSISSTTWKKVYLFKCSWLSYFRFKLIRAKYWACIIQYK